MFDLILFPILRREDLLNVSKDVVLALRAVDLPHQLLLVKVVDDRHRAILISVEPLLDGLDVVVDPARSLTPL